MPDQTAHNAHAPGHAERRGPGYWRVTPVQGEDGDPVTILTAHDVILPVGRSSPRVSTSGRLCWLVRLPQGDWSGKQPDGWLLWSVQTTC
jgi:hypothetical protein